MGFNMKKKYIISLLLSLVMFSGAVGAETFDYLEEEPFDVVFDLTNDDVNEIIDEQLFLYFLTYDKNKEFSDGYIDFLDKNFGKGKMSECIEFLLRLKKMS